MKKQLQDQVKEAMRSKDKVRLETIRGILSAAQYLEMETGKEELSEQEYVGILQREIKKRKEELEFAEKAGRAEAIEKISSEIKVVEAFLPSQLSEKDIEKILVDLKAKDPSVQLGVAMKHLRDGYAGQYDGKVASEVAKRILG